MSGHYETVGYPDYGMDYWEELGADAVLVNNVEQFVNIQKVIQTKDKLFQKKIHSSLKYKYISFYFQYNYI